MNFQNQIDYLPSMFDDINLPEELNHELVVSSIVKRCGLLTPVYSEPALMKDAIDLWFNANQWTLQHLHGNIGVTSNQDMINQEIALLEKFHVYDWIALQIEADLFIILY